MAAPKDLVGRVRDILSDQKVTEKRMFGGLTFMVDGHMCCGVGKDGLMVRVGPDAYDNAIGQPGARPLDFTGRPMKGLVWIDPQAVSTKRMLTKWIAKGINFVNTLPRRN